MRFLVLWSFFVIILVGLALITDINWVRKVLATALTNTFHKEVHLGQLHWSFAPDGVSISANKVQVLEKDGSPFMFSRHARIGIAIHPLLSGKLAIRHLYFREPELWAVRLAKQTWNFDDMLKSCPDIRYIEVERGRVHVIDQSHNRSHRQHNGEWEPLNLCDINLKLLWPRKNSKTPFSLSLRIPQKDYTTSAQVHGFAEGPFKQWQKNNYAFDLSTTNLHPRDFAPILKALSRRQSPAPATPLIASKPATVNWLLHPKYQHTIKVPITQPDEKQVLDGFFNVQAKGKGSFEHGIRVSLTTNVERLSFAAPFIGPVQAGGASAKGQLLVAKEKIAWNDFVITGLKMTVKTKGQLANWHNNNKSYSATINGEIQETGLDSLTHPSADHKNAPLDKEKLTEAAEIAMQIAPGTDKPKIVTDIKMHSLKLGELIKYLPDQLSQALSLLALSKSSQTVGDIHIVPEQRIDIKHAQIGDVRQGSQFYIEGFSDARSNTCRYQFHGEGLSLEQAQQGLRQSDRRWQSLAHTIWAPLKQNVLLSGKFDLSGLVALSRITQNNRIELHFRLNDAELALSDKSFYARKVNGTGKFENGSLTIEHVSGMLGNGQFQLSCTTKAKERQCVNWHFHGNNINVAQLGNVLQMFKIKLPILSEHQLYGEVSTIDLNIAGSSNKPIITMRAIPKDLYYKPLGLSRSLRATSGSILYTQDNLTLDKVAFINHADKVTLSIDIVGLSREAKVRHVSVKTDGVNLSDVNYYLSSGFVPTPLKKLYLDFLDSYTVSRMHGRIYGELACNLGLGKANIDGVVGLVNVGLKIRGENFPIEHMNGTLAASDNKLQFRDLRGSVRNTHFAMDGYIDRYKTPSPSWKTDICATIDPEELLAIEPMLGDQIKKWNLYLTSTKPLNLKAQLSSTSQSTVVVFALLADAPNHVVFAGPFGSLHKPAGVPLTLDGSLSIDSNKITIEHGHLLLGDAVFFAAGSIDRIKVPNETTSADKPSREVNFTVTAPNPVPARTLVSMLDPSFPNADTEGNFEGRLSINGKLKDPRVRGHLSLERLTFPKLNLFDLTGKIEVKDIIHESKASNNSEHEASVKLQQIRLGRLLVKDVTSQLVFEPVSGCLKQPRIRISHGNAQVAGGKLTIDGLLDLNNHRLSFKSTVSQVKAAEVIDGLLNLPGEITGLIDAQLHIDTRGSDYREAISNLDGKGMVTICNGTVARFGRLQARLTQANLLHQGLLGFNLNNLLQSVVPVRTGQFKELSAHFQIRDGILSLEELSYRGDDMRMWGAGKANLPLNTLELELAGKIPRVVSSIISGPVGEMSRAVTIPRMMNVVTLGRLSSLPQLPILGNLASDRPRTFMFKIWGPMDKPKTIAQSIEKTFQWLPERPNASAHPVPGL